MCLACFLTSGGRKSQCGNGAACFIPLLAKKRGREPKQIMKLKQSGTLAPVNEPWTLIRDAIHDLTLQEKQKGVEIRMGHWHSQYGGVCLQCLAGSVMSRRLGADTDAHKYPDSFPEDVEARLHALDDLRCGATDHAYCELKLVRPASLPDHVTIPRYLDGPDAFKETMLKLADLLEAA